MILRERQSFPRQRSLIATRGAKTRWQHSRTAPLRSLIVKFVRLSSTSFLLSFVLMLPFFAHASEITANISGTVKDSTGAVVPSASVTLTNTDTNVPKTFQTESDGTYLFRLVPIGNYQITAERAGFRKYVHGGIVLNLNQNAKLDITLQPGETKEVVEVQGDVTQVDTATATLGSVETERRILDLPLVERDTFQLGLLQAGVFPIDDDDGSGNPFSVSGQRSESVSFLINGTDNNNFLGNNAVVDPNPDAVEEFKILTNNYSSEYGRTSGGIVNQVIKAGTNSFHGDIFEFLRNDALNAANYFTKTVTPFKRNTFGGTLGGPIFKNKTFFFVAYQGERRREGQTIPVLPVLSPAERTGDFSELLPKIQLVDPTTKTGDPYVNNQVPINPVIANYIAKYLPLPNIPGTNNFVASPVAPIEEDQIVSRIDHHFGQNDTIYGTYIVDDLRESFPLDTAGGGGNVPLGSGFDDANREQLFTASWLHNFTSRLVNEFIFGANRSAHLTATPHDKTAPSALGFTNVHPDDPAGTAPPVMITPSFNLGPAPGGPTKIHDATFHFQNNVSYTRGKHDLKFGADIRRVRNNFRFDFDNNGIFDFAGISGNFTGDALADFAGGFYDNYFQFSRAIYGIRTKSLHFYAQDSWKILPRLTLSYGMRYEYNSPLRDIHNEILGYFPGQQSTRFPQAPTGILYPGDPGTPNTALAYPDRNNFAPRFGLAWDVFGTAKFVVRGGGGIFYDIEDGALNLQFGGQAPFGFVTSINPISYSSPLVTNPLADPFGASGQTNPYPSGSTPVGTFATPKVSFAYVVDPRFRTPYSENFNFGFQFQALKDTLVEAYYVGSLSRKAVITRDLNAPLPSILMAQQLNPIFKPNGSVYNADCARPLAGCADPTDPTSSLTNIGQLLTNSSSGTGASNQLQLTVDKRFSHGFNLRGAYTLAKTIDTQSGFRYGSSLFTNPFDQRFDRGLANFDVRHRLVISGLWEIPWNKPFHGGFLKKLTEGWQLNGIASFQTGTPFTIFSGADSSHEATGLDRCNVVGPTHTLDPRSHGDFYFKPAAYDCTAGPGHVADFTYGNSGRNSIHGPGRNSFDLSFVKSIKFTETRQLEFRTELFNAFNHTAFMNPDHTASSGTFGQVTQARDARIIQLALKFYF